MENSAWSQTEKSEKKTNIYTFSKDLNVLVFKYSVSLKKLAADLGSNSKVTVKEHKTQCQWTHFPAKYGKAVESLKSSG